MTTSTLLEGDIGVVVRSFFLSAEQVGCRGGRRGVREGGVPVQGAHVFWRCAGLAVLDGAAGLVAGLA